jgi:hypothetical protein
MRSITAKSLQKNTCRRCRGPETALHRPQQPFFFSAAQLACLPDCSLAVSIQEDIRRHYLLSFPARQGSSFRRPGQIKKQHRQKSQKHPAAHHRDRPGIQRLQEPFCGAGSFRKTKERLPEIRQIRRDSEKGGGKLALTTNGVLLLPGASTIFISRMASLPFLSILWFCCFPLPKKIQVRKHRCVRLLLHPFRHSRSGTRPLFSYLPCQGIELLHPRTRCYN